jgi:putative peptidoglycan binding protein
MIRHRIETRKARLGVVSALVLGCALTASARQDSAAGEPPHKSTTTKSTATKKSSTSKAASSSNTVAGSTSGKAHSASSRKRYSRKKSARVRGQQKIDSERAQAIQEALIREHYLSGEATGTWNPASEEAMRRYQADNGWQSKTVPDSRALIKLGLGPSKDHLLNPESAMTTAPDAPRAEHIPTTSHTAPAVANPAPPAAPAPTPASSSPSGPQ